MSQQEVIEITDLDRTENYIQFQLSVVETELQDHYEAGNSPIHFVHLVKWKKSLEAELVELRKSR